MNKIYWLIIGIVFTTIIIGAFLFKTRVWFKFAPMFNFWPTVNSWNYKIRQRMAQKDQNPLFSILADKYKVKDYVKTKSNLVKVPKIYYVTQDPATIPFDELPENYVIKANHGSRWNIIIKNGIDMKQKKPANQEDLMNYYSIGTNSLYYVKDECN
jgi:hypothetical protein